MWNRFRLRGTRYAYISHLNDTLSVPETNGMEVKGNFKAWEGFKRCGTNHRKLFGLHDDQTYISFYSPEGNKPYLITCNLNDWWTRLQHFFRD